MRRAPGPLLSAGVVGALLTGTMACGPSSLDAYCDRVAEVATVGPLFPARTDGEPVPHLEALEAIEAMAAAAPDEVADDAAVLAGAARALVDEAEARRTNRSTFDPTDRWSPSVVEEAQNAVIDHADTECGIDLTQLGRD